MPGFLAEVLYQEKNRGVLTLLRTAKDWGVPPMTVVKGGGRTGEWGYDDALLATALTILDSELCNSCGTPAWLGHSTDNRIQFNIEDTTCHACAEKDKQAEERSKAKKGAKEHGKSYYPVPYNVFPGQSLPSRSDEYERRAKAAAVKAQKGGGQQ